MQCLRMLAEEAASLRLARTLAALREAIDVCAAENVMDAPADGPQQDSVVLAGRPLTRTRRQAGPEKAGRSRQEDSAPAATPHGSAHDDWARR